MTVLHSETGPRPYCAIVIVFLFVCLFICLFHCVLCLSVCLIVCLSLFVCGWVIWCLFNGLSVCYWVIVLLFVFFCLLTVVHADTGPFVLFIRSLLRVCQIVYLS